MNKSDISCPNNAVREKTVSCLINNAIEGIDNNSIKKRDLIWLELNGCSGNIISLLNGENPGFSYLVNKMTNFIYSNSLCANEGEQAMKQLFDESYKDYILAVEGAVSEKDNGALNIIGRIGDKKITGLEAVKILGEKASHVLAVGSCASFGGISAASPNPSECTGVQSVLDRKVINLTGCPCHPDWFLGTLSYIMLYGEPALSDSNRPLMFYSVTIHDRCPRRADFDRGVFAKSLGEDSCMFKLGCRGPVTQTDCPIRRWNSQVNWPVGTDSVCIGCAQFGFPDAMSPFVSYPNT